MPRKPVTKPSPRTADSKCNQVVKHPFFTRLRNGLADNRTQLIIGLLIGALALFLLLAYFSFFVSGRHDFSILQLSPEERRAARESISNWVGLPGAHLSRFLIDGSYGLVSLVFIVLLGVYGLHLMKVVHVRCWRWFFCSVFWLVWGSAALAFVQDMLHAESFFRWGGAHGEWLSRLVCSYLQPLGFMLVFLISLVVFLILTDRQFLPNMKRLGEWLRRLFTKNDRQEDLVADPTAPLDLDAADADDEQAGPVLVDFPEAVPAADVVSETAAAMPALQIADTADGEHLEPLENEPELEPEDEPELLSADIETGKSGEDQPIDTGLEINQVVEDEQVEQDPEYLLRKLGPYDPRKDLENYHFPPLDLLKIYNNETAPVINKEEQQANANRIVTTLRNYGIEIEQIKATVGPTVTLYEVVPKAGTRIVKIQSLENDIMLSLAATGIRIIAPMPGKGTVGIEVPNETPQTVSMHSVIASKRFQEEQKMRLPIAIGRTITNEVFMFDLAKTPHLLVAGATGQGKSVAINAIITSLLYKKHPAELKFVLVDPKKVEFSPYRALMRHYLAAMPGAEEKEIIITDCQKVIDTLNSLVIEMENRYELLEDAGVRNLEDYNEKFVNRRLNPEKVVANNLHHQFLPYLVIIIDEYGDFIMQAGKQVETPIARITQKARAVGMHMILATQRPSVNIVTGVIKANIPTRIALRTQSVVDSRTVLDAKGADQLVGKGDMLYSGNGTTTRIQCAFVDTPEVDQIVAHVKEQQHYFEPYQLPEYISGEAEGEALQPGSVDMKRLDPMFADVARYVVTKQEGSTSRLQRAFEIGYNRAGKLSDQLEAAGIVGPNKGPKGRDVLIQDMESLEQILQGLGV
ncbi:MAG: DNA translocase FtsK [Paludibacteraceae bacterium]|nr:DNA translocase FtsK [Paludibacteraceae bacterium]